MIDKILLLLLVIMLPVGIVASKQLFQPSLSADQQAAQQAKKVDELIAKINNQSGNTAASTTQDNPFNITSVSFASAAATVSVSGLAPSGKQSVRYEVAELPPDTIPELSNNAVNAEVLGQTVTVKAIKPHPDGTFTLEYPTKALSGVVEITITQGQAAITIQYDLGLKKRVL